MFSVPQTKNGFGPFPFSFFVPIRAGLPVREVILVKVLHFDSFPVTVQVAFKALEDIF